MLMVQDGEDWFKNKESSSCPLQGRMKDNCLYICDSVCMGYLRRRYIESSKLCSSPDTRVRKNT